VGRGESPRHEREPTLKNDFFLLAMQQRANQKFIFQDKNYECAFDQCFNQDNDFRCKYDESSATRQKESVKFSI
jgi:hypothetical protein